MNRAKSLEQEMRGYKPRVPSGVSLEEEPQASKKGPRRKLRGVRFERAENGFTGHPDFELQKNKKGEPMLETAGEKPHVFTDVGGLHKFLDDHWK